MTDPRRAPQPGRAKSSARRATARIVAVAALALTAALVLHPAIPGVVGTGVATVLPWLGLLVPVLLWAALATRRRVWIVTLVPLIAWLLVVGPLFVPLQTGSAADAAESTLTVASQNVEAGSGGAAESALMLAEQGADVIALEELDGVARAEVAEAIDDAYPYSYRVGTVGLWSQYPIVNEQPLDLGLGWNRALAADLDTPSGLVSVYVVHAASLRPGAQSDRDDMLANLAEVVAQDENERVLVVGDFNATLTDPALRALQRSVSESNRSTASLGFTWPSTMPLARIDHIFHAGLTPLESSVLPAGNSDHLAVLTTFGM
ncbi:endonuclease/exonuclease/phosphatase family protein [Microterricola viridarii]|uniref:Vancomycin resistance protein VanJ n=1 Tax=Microterricola viridarii TaxID=412690 RepID=A0A1H1UHI5_9MICO|nr:endonuclease/exonuclease/phosphatase family protein [Microterricola viridarii]SDS72004.1 vancomycin resistance protein VanJ [Microterricola viridarii]